MKQSFSLFRFRAFWGCFGDFEACFRKEVRYVGGGFGEYDGNPMELVHMVCGVNAVGFAE